MDASHRDGVAEETALLFPGQGVQSLGMARWAYDSCEPARHLFAEASNAAGFDMNALCFEGPAGELQRSSRQQPAILTASLAIRAASDRWAAPSVVAGHSLGLYGALVSAGSLTAIEAIAIVAERGRLMDDAGHETQGAMTAILGLDDDIVERVCVDCSAGADVVVAANFNCPGQVVISGTAAAVERASVRLRECGARKTVPLPVSGAFHSPLMAGVTSKMRQVLDSAPIRDAEIPVVANTSARLLQKADDIRYELVTHIEAAVRWTDGIRLLEQRGVTCMVDCGPGGTIAALVKKTLGAGSTLTIERLDQQ